MKVYSLLSQEIRTLVNEEKEAGYYSVRWDGRGELGEKMSSGVYIYRLEAGKFVQSRKMILLK